MTKTDRRSRLKLMLFLWLLIIITIFGVWFYTHYISSPALVKAAKSDLEQQTDFLSIQIHKILIGIEKDVRFLSNVPPVQGIIRAAQHDGIDPLEKLPTDTWKDRLATSFLDFVQKEKPKYTQIRYLEKDGDEMVRVDYDSDEQYRVVPPDQLQNRAETAYFKETAKLFKNGVYVSSLEFNQERGIIERLFKPIIRYANPIFDEENNTFEGIIVLNVNAKWIFKPLSRKSFRQDFLVLAFSC